MNKSSPLLSVVTVTLNCASKARETARSVLEQDFADCEYIVKDGGSRDDTVASLQALGVQRVQVARDTGIYNAMNQALGLCSGKYVCFLNAGDVFASGQVLSEVARHIQARESSQLVYGDILRSDCSPVWQKQMDYSSRLIRYRSKLTSFYLYRRMVCHQAWFTRVDLLRGCGGFDERYGLLADYDLLLKLVLQQGIAYSHVASPLVVYEGGGATDVLKEEASRQRALIIPKYFNRWERTVFASVTCCARGVVHNGLFLKVQAAMPGGWKSRLAGF